MTINYSFDRLIISGFRGIDQFELNFLDGFVHTLIGPNNAGKSTILNAMALVLNGGGSHQWQFTEQDFFRAFDENTDTDFSIQLFFRSENEMDLPAVKGVGKPILVYGSQVRGKLQKNGKIRITKSLIDKNGDTISFSNRTPLPTSEKDIWKNHSIGYRPVNAKLDDVYDHMPEVWLFTPQNIENSLFVWKTGPLLKLGSHLATRFLNDKWQMEVDGGQQRKMPETLTRAYGFFQEAVSKFPFWKDDMKPKLENTFQRYVGTHSSIELKPDTQTIESWLAQQLAIDLATDPNSARTPLKNMGDGWQSLMRLAALDALTHYPDLMRERVVLLIEEPETHLHPHLRRQMREVLASLSDRGWTVILTTHSSEIVSFNNKQSISRLVRKNGKVIHRQLDPGKISSAAKLQSKLDQNGAHDFLFSSRAVFCEGVDDVFSLSLALDQLDIERNSRSVSITNSGGIENIPSFIEIASSLGIPWCAITDEDRVSGGTIKPKTLAVRQKISDMRSSSDQELMWAVDLETCLKVDSGKAKPDVSNVKLQDSKWQNKYPEFSSTVSDVSSWITEI